MPQQYHDIEHEKAEKIYKKSKDVLTEKGAPEREYSTLQKQKDIQIGCHHGRTRGGAIWHAWKWLTK
jgi:hypothetical protein